MEDTLKRLLAAEEQAEALIKQAESERDAAVREAEAEVKRMEAKFRAQIPKIQASFREKAEGQAQEALMELNGPYDRSITRLREQMERHEQEAVDAAIALLLGSGES